MDPIRLSKLLEATQLRLKDTEARAASLEVELGIADKKARDAMERCRQSELETKRYAKAKASLEQAFTAMSKELVETKKSLQAAERKAENESVTLRTKLKIQSEEMAAQGEDFEVALCKQQLLQGSVYSYRQNVRRPDLKLRSALIKL